MWETSAHNVSRTALPWAESGRKVSGSIVPVAPGPVLRLLDKAVGPWSWVWGRGVLTGLQKRQVLPISQPTENSQFSNCEPNVNFFRPGSSFVLGKRQHLISKLGREDFKRFKIQLRKLLGHQIAFLK